MSRLLIALACLLAPFVGLGAAFDESKSSGLTLYEGVAAIIANGPYAEDHKLWARMAARAADGNNWLEQNSKTLISSWYEKALRPENKASWYTTESITLLSAMMRQCDALDMGGRFPLSPTITRNALAARVKLDPKAPALIRLTWLREEILWNRRSIDPRSDGATALFLQELTRAVNMRAPLTNRQWGQLADFIPHPDSRARVFRIYGPAKEYPPLLEALLKAEDFRPATMRHLLLAISYYNQGWIERGGQFDDKTSDEQRLAFRKNIALAYKEVLSARKTATADNCNLTPLFRVITYSGAGPRAGNSADNQAQMTFRDFLEECLLLGRSDRERTEIVQAYLTRSEDDHVTLIKTLREAIALYGSESGVAIESLRYRSQLHNTPRRQNESDDDLNTRALRAANKEMPKAIALATEIQQNANKRRERLAYNGQFIDPKAIALALIPRYNHSNNPDIAVNLRLALAMPDSRYGAPTEDDVDFNARHFLTFAPHEYPYRDRTGVFLLTERPSLEAEWWGWPSSTEQKLAYEPSFIESWAQPGKIDQVLTKLTEVENAQPPLSTLSHERLRTLRRVAEVTREFQSKGVLTLPWNDPAWRDKTSHYYMSSKDAGLKINIGSRRFTLTDTLLYSDQQIMELRAPLPQPYAIEFEFEHLLEVLPQKYPYPKYISMIGIWTQDPDENVQAMFTGIRTSEQAQGVYFTPDPKGRWAKANFFPFPASHPKANGKAKAGKARVEVREGHVIWFLDGIQLFDSKKAGYPPMPVGLLRLGLLSSGDFPGTANLSAPTITKLK